MNMVVLMGRLTRDPEVRYSQGEQPTAIARYTLAVDRRFTRRNDPDGQTADFINCVVFGKGGEFAERYLKKGTKIAVTGRIQTRSYTNKEGVKVYTTEVIVDNQEFAESKAASQANGGGQGSFGGQSGYNGGGYGGGFDNAPQEAPSYGNEQPSAPAGDFMNIQDGIEEELPFA